MQKGGGSPDPEVVQQSKARRKNDFVAAFSPVWLSNTFTS